MTAGWRNHTSAAVSYGRCVRRRLLLLVVLATLLVTPVRSAGAHEEVPGIRNELVEVEPALPPGITVQVVISAADQLVVANTSDEVLEVPGADGEPFLRIGPDGVAANFQSPTWHRTLNPDEGGALPPEADADAAPRFVRVSTEPSWGWFDHRLHVTAVRTAPAVEPGETVVLEEWAVPMRVGGAEFVVRGRRVYSRPTGAFVATIASVPDGVRAAVLAGPVPAIAVSRTGDADVELLDEVGDVFAVVGEQVLVDESSPLWRLTEAVRSTGEQPVVPEVGDRSSSMVPYEAGGQLIWLEPRAVYPSETPPDDVSDEDPTVVLEWQVPVRIGDREDAIVGTTSWVPAGAEATAAPVPIEGDGADGSLPWWSVPVVVGLGGSLLALVLWRRNKTRQVV